MIDRKKAEIKKSIRNMIKDTAMAYTLIRHDVSSLELNVTGKPYGHMITFDEYNDDGDISTDAEHDEIYEAIKLIVDEHNQSLD